MIDVSHGRDRYDVTAVPGSCAGRPVLLCLLAMLAVLRVVSAKDSPIQVDVRPFGLDIVDTVQLAGSDAPAAVFQADTLPSLRRLLRGGLVSGLSVDGSTAIALDPSRLDLINAADVRVYFVGEKTDYHNTLGFNTVGGGITSGKPLLIFPDASMGRSRTDWTPLRPGDFVDLGSMTGGTQLDFFLIANGRRGGKDVFSTDLAVNPDGIAHAISYAVPDSPYLLVGFEDRRGGGDLDFDDLFFAVDVGKDNVAALSGVPEPVTLLSLAAFAGIVVCAKRRKRK